MDRAETRPTEPPRIRRTRAALAAVALAAVAAVALAAVAAVALAACTPRPEGPYEACRRDPGPHRDRTRHAVSTRQNGLWWDDFQGPSPPQEDWVLSIAHSIRDCLHSVHVEGQGTVWDQGGFQSIDLSTLRQDLSGRHIAFIGHMEEKLFVVVDGARSGPYLWFIRPPDFSPDGRHSGYLAKDDEGPVLVIDGQSVMRASDFHASVFSVLDGGHYAVAPKRSDGTYEIIVAGVKGPPVTDFCDMAVPVILPSGRFAIVGRRGEKYVPIIDGRAIDAPGVPARCEILFSPDGARWGWVALHAGPTGLTSSEKAAVIDGAVHPIPDGSTGAELSFVAGLAIVRIQTPDPLGMSIHGYRKWEYVHWFVDLATPSVRPTEDSYATADNGGTVEWARVRIGASLGPRFDRIERWSTHVDEVGRLHYIGERNGARVEVVDTVIVR